MNIHLPFVVDVSFVFVVIVDINCRIVHYGVCGLNVWKTLALN